MSKPQTITRAQLDESVRVLRHVPALFEAARELQQAAEELLIATGAPTTAEGLNLRDALYRVREVLGAIEEPIARPARRPERSRPEFVSCGSCGAYHRADFAGDCRQDSERFYCLPINAVIVG